MNYATAWFLVAMAGQQYIGPMSQTACQMAGANLRAEGVECRQASAMTACPVPGVQGIYTSCPVFDYPHVTLKAH